MKIRSFCFSLLVSQATSSCPPSIFPSDYQLQSRPDLVDGTDLHIHQPQGQRHGPDDILGDGTRDAGRFLGPGNPDHAIRDDLFEHRRKFGLQFVTVCREEMNKIQSRRKLPGKLCPRGKRAQQFKVVSWRIDGATTCAGLEAKLFQQRSPGVASRRLHVLASPPSGP